jgi:hypothetical protein
MKSKKVIWLNFKSNYILFFNFYNAIEALFSKKFVALQILVDFSF